MKSVTYAYVGPEDQAAKFAKKGTTTDVTLFNAKKGDLHLNLVTAARYPDKLSSLLVALDLADEIILHPAAVDRSFGESIVGAKLFGKTRGFCRTGPATSADVLRPYLVQAGLETLTVTDESDALLRDKLYESCAEGAAGDAIVPVDHAFPVKGVGTVILGLVRRGQVEAHQVLQAHPGTKTIDVRSIQVHDVDVKTAPARSRVGLAVKGVEADELPRGTILAPPGSLKVLPTATPHKALIEPSPFAKWQPKAGAVLHLFHVLQDIVVRVDEVGTLTKGHVDVTLRVESPLTHVPDQPAVLVDLDHPRQRFIGRVRFTG